MKPTYQLTINGEDRTQALAHRVSALSLVDAGGEKSDTLQLDLVDDGTFSLPEVGAEISAMIGFEGHPLLDMGIFVLDKLTVKGPPSLLSIAAAGVPFSRSHTFKKMTARKSRSWDAGPLARVLLSVGKEYGLKPVAAPGILSQKMPHLDQTAESDISFLRRICEPYNLLLKPTHGRLNVFVRGSSQSARGEQLPPVALSRNAVSSYNFVRQERVRHSGVRAHYHNAAAGTDQFVVAGDVADLYEIREPFADQAAAQAGAEAKLETILRKGLEARVDLPGRTDIFVGTPVNLSDIRRGLNGAWRVVKVNHRIDQNGWLMGIDLDTKNLKV